MKFYDPSLLSDQAGDHSLRPIVVIILGLAIAGAAYAGWMTTMNRKEERRVAKICDGFIKEKALAENERARCEASRDVRKAANTKSMSKNANEVAVLVSKGSNKLIMQFSAKRPHAYPKLAPDQQIPSIMIDAPADAPRKFQIEMKTVWIDDPDAETTNWVLSGNRVDNGEFMSFDLDGVAPVDLKEVGEGCYPLFLLGEKAGCRAVALIEMQDADGTPGSFPNYIVTGLKIIPPTATMIDQAIAGRKETK